MPKTTCLVNNYNYCKFVVQAIESALTQSVPFDEIIVVDDLSTDNSVDIIKEKYQDESRIKIVVKDKNEGQLSAFNEGFLKSSGEIICFLDADDIYPRTYLESLLSVYEKNPGCGCIYSDRKKFKDNEQIDFKDAENSSPGEYSSSVLKSTVVQTYYLKLFQSAPTSAISFRRKYLETILPIPYLEDWRIRADDCLTCGAALTGIQRIKLRGNAIHYRIHSNNNFACQLLDANKRQKDYGKEYKRRVALNRFAALMCKRMGYDLPLFPEIVKDEFRAIDQPSWRDFWTYLSIAFWSDIPFIRRARNVYLVVEYMLFRGKSIK